MRWAVKYEVSSGSIFTGLLDMKSGAGNFPAPLNLKTFLMNVLPFLPLACLSP